MKRGLGTLPEPVFLPGLLTNCPQPVNRAAPALECGEERLDYGQLAERVHTIAARLAHRGIGPGARVALVAQRNLDSYVAMLAVLALGAAYVPLELSYPPARLADMSETADVDLVVGDRAALASLPSHTTRELALDGDDGARASPVLEDIDAARLAYILFTSGSTGTPKGVAMPRGPLTRLIGWHSTQSRLAGPARTLAFAPMTFDVHFQEVHST